MTAPEEAALDALAEALAPRLLRLLRERAGLGDDGLAELLADAGFELDAAPVAAPTAKPTKKARAA